MNLSRLRRQIDRVDLALLRLLNRRASLALRVGALKKKKSLPVFDGRRENQVLRLVVRTNQGPLPGRSLSAIFGAILRHSRSLQGTGTTRGRNRS